MNFRIAVVLAAIVLSPAARATAIDLLPSNLDGYRITSWTGGDGITLGDVKSIVQDRDGYLWIGCDVGLVRFDGSRFTASAFLFGANALPQAPSHAVYVARDGSLWAGYGKGRGIYHIVAGEVREVQLEGRTSGFVNVIAEDRAGDMWVGHDGGLLRFHKGQWETIALQGAGPQARVLDVHEDRTGALWVASIGGLFRRPADAADFERGGYGSGSVRGISESPSGVIWTTDDRTGFRRADAGSGYDLFEARGMSVLHDSKGNLWVPTTGQGLFQIQNLEVDGAAPLVRRATAQSGLVSDEGSVTLEDRQGNIWVGSIQGLTRLAPDKVLSIIDIGVVQALTVGKDGTAWAGTTRGLLALRNTGPHLAVTTRLISPVGIRALHTSANGTVWAGTDEGLHRIEGGQLVPVTLNGRALPQITSIASDQFGHLWICDETAGLVRVTRGYAEHVPIAVQGTNARPIFTRVDRANRVWVALEGGSVAMLDGARVTTYGPAEGLSHSVINVIHQDRTGDIWIGGTGGLSRLRDGRFQTLSFLNEVGDRLLADVIDDESGNVWIAFSFFGFIRVNRNDLSRAIDDPSYPLVYHVDNTAYRAGYPRASFAGDPNLQTDRAIWMVSTRGLIVLDPNALPWNQDVTSARPLIEGITADSRRFSPTTKPNLPARTDRLQIDYTVVNLSSPDRIRFRYRLDGFDRNWVDGTGPRQAAYTNLPPGSYRFRLQSSTNATAWNSAEADWSFSIQPMFYQTRWFYLACAVAVALLSIGAWQLRIRQVRKELALVFGERLRMSREIHDTLLQGLYGVALHLDAAPRDGSDQHALPLHLQRTRRQIEDCISEARQSISNLRSPALDRSDLVGALREMGERLTSGKVSFALTVTGMPRRCPQPIENEIFRIGHEAVMNAVRHADAERVEMEIAFSDEALRLRVADDGRGFDSELAPGFIGAGHYGLVSMRERAAGAGGCCTIDAVPGAGVEVVAEFPHRRIS